MVQAATLWRGCHWRLLAVGGPLTVLGTLAGTASLFYIGKSIWLKRGVGALLLGLLVNAYDPSQPVGYPDSWLLLSQWLVAARAHAHGAALLQQRCTSAIDRNRMTHFL